MSTAIITTNTNVRSSHSSARRGRSIHTGTNVVPSEWTTRRRNAIPSNVRKETSIPTKMNAASGDIRSMSIVARRSLRNAHTHRSSTQKRANVASTAIQSMRSVASQNRRNVRMERKRTANAAKSPGGAVLGDKMTMMTNVERIVRTRRSVTKIGRVNARRMEMESIFRNRTLVFQTIFHRLKFRTNSKHCD